MHPLSARGLLPEILGNDESFRLLCSLAAGAEAREAAGNSAVAAFLPPERCDLAAELTRYAAEQDRHACLLRSLCRERGLEPLAVPAAMDHAFLLEERGGCLAHVRVRRGEPLTERDAMAHLAHGVVACRRACAWLTALADCCADPEEARRMRDAARTREGHLAYCERELLRLTGLGYGAAVDRILRDTALAESRIRRGIALAVLARTGRALGWPLRRRAVPAGLIRAVCAWEQLAGWRRAVHLDRPEHAGPPAAGTDPPAASLGA